MVVEGVDILEEPLDKLRRNHFELFHQSAELSLIDHTIIISVNTAEFLGEATQELFMLPKLEVEHSFEEKIEL